MAWARLSSNFFFNGRLELKLLAHWPGQAEPGRPNCKVVALVVLVARKFREYVNKHTHRHVGLHM